MSSSAMDDYSDGYGEDSDADDEYERSSSSPTLQADYPTSPTESDRPPSNQQTPTYSRNTKGFKSPRDTILEWTADNCADYVAELGMEQYADTFVDEKINGEALVALLHEDLKDMGITSMGHRLTILSGVYDIKIKQNIPIEPDHYVPLSADANAPDSHPTQDDIARIINQIKLRDERLLAAEEELRILKEDLNRVWEDSRRLREDVLPVIRVAKDKNQPLPTPEGVSHNENLPSPHSVVQQAEPKSGGGSVSRKLSTKKLFLGRDAKMPSPTIHEPTSLDPSAAAKAASSQLTASMSSQNSQASPRFSQQPSPTSPPYTSQHPRTFARNDGGPPSSRYATTSDEGWTANSHDRSTANTTARRGPTSMTGNASNAGAEDFAQPQAQLQSRGQASHQQPNSASSDGSTTNAPSSGGSGAMEFMKSFRVSMDEPCHKVLPVALKKYHIQDDWRQYSLYIVHGDQERCLGLDERPLILFKQLASEGKKPMFMLRKHAAPAIGFDTRATGGVEGPAGAAGASGAANASSGLGTGMQQSGQNTRVQSYAESVQLPGGVF